MLGIISESLEELLSNQNVNLTTDDRIAIFKDKIGYDFFPRQDYMRVFRDISSATASRDLKYAVDKKIIEKKGDKNATKYRLKAK